MATLSLPPSTSIFVKTALGRDEIQHRSLRLPPLLRRLLLLVDGERNATQLTPFVAGQDVDLMLQELVELGCVQAATVMAPPSVAPATPAATATPATPVATAAVVDMRDPPAASKAAPAITPSIAEASALPVDLPDAASRTPAQVDMARNFMINTINALLEPNTRLSLVKKIFGSVDAASLREHYPQWDEAIGSSWSGARRQSELRQQLFAVL